MSIVTDSKGLEDSKDPEMCNVFALYKLFADEDNIDLMRQNYIKGGYGYGHAKRELFDKLWQYFEPIRLKREELAADKAEIQNILKKGGEKARAEAAKTLSEVRNVIGL
jgi:tryptophanyl-tRNA synthetase